MDSESRARIRGLEWFVRREKFIGIFGFFLNSGYFKSECKVWFKTYGEVHIIIRSEIDWNVWFFF